jgi:hypothetical protein
MRRRKFIQAIAAIPAAAVAVPLPLIGQYQRNERQGNATGSSVGQTPPQGQSAPVLKTVYYAEAGTTPVPNFFSEIQFSALSRLSDLFLPPLDGKPGALDSGAAEFLDFYVGASSVSHQQLYKAGLDDLNAQAKLKFGKTFADLNNTDADSIIKPMFKPRGPLQGWLELGPFVNRAYQDIWTVTVNSPAWAASAKSSGRPTFAPLYWEKVDPTVLLFAGTFPTKQGREE